MTTLEVIRILCAKENITISKLEKILGYSHGAITKAKNVNAERLLEIADYFGVTIESLIKGEVDFSDKKEENYYYDEEVAEIAQAMFDRPDLKVLFDASRNMSKEDIQFIQTMIERMK